jgi:hypothetical protein
MSSEALARIAELEMENEELRERLDAAERSNADLATIQKKNDERRVRLAKAEEEVADLRARRVALEGKQARTGPIATIFIAFVIGAILAFARARSLS